MLSTRAAAATLIERLGYTQETGWIASCDFHRLANHRFALEQASAETPIHGAFCLLRPGPNGELSSTPLVYVALADGTVEAQEVHRKVWSQGLVPFLLVATPDEVIVCPGFSYSQRDWNGLVHRFPWSVIEELPASPLDPGRLTGPAAELWDLRGIRLRTALFWRDHSIDVDGRVDRRLLGSLEGLSKVLIDGNKEIKKLSPAAANGLIGRFLYVYFLVDRKIIDQDWMASRGHAIALDDKFGDWSPQATWALFADLDSIFNGSIFPLEDDERETIDGDHINLVRRVMKHGSEPLPSGGEQLSFLDFHLGTLRTETLSSVYEQFLENLRAGERRRSGAFYTPPFLVDFMLDRLEEEKVLADGVSVLDPAAGSGVFLVGAYRRMVERARWSRTDEPLELDELRGILTRNIFGIERNRDACHVAAFSLYLTLLDYVSPRDLTRVAAGEEPEKLFPPLIDSNIHNRDFFDVSAPFATLPDAVDCVVGNPPWQALSKLESDHALAWYEQHRREAPIGNDQAAELFVWKALARHLAPDGLLALLLPAKSFINPTSETFRLSLGRRYTIVGAANFAHLRYRLFASARQAVVAAFVRPRPPVTRDQSWIYSPLSVGQPLARKEWPWTVMLDRADIQTVRHDIVARDPRGWFDAFLLRPVDRHIRRFLSDGSVTGRIGTLQSLCAAVGAGISRGGNPGETGVDRRYLMDAPGSDGEEADGTSPLFGDTETETATDIWLPSDQWENVRPSYRNRFGGNVLLIPRNLKSIRLVTRPCGYTSSTTAMFFNKPADLVSARELALLQAVGRFLRSKVGLYLVATTGRRWLMDRRNIEPEDLKALSIPIVGLDDPRIDGILAADPEDLTDYLLEILGIDGDLRRAIDEFLGFRIGFRDGEVPKQALSLPDGGSLQSYVDVVHRTLDGLIGREQAFQVKALSHEHLGVAAVATRFRPAQGGAQDVDDLVRSCRAALDRYVASSANSFCDGLALSYENDTESVTVIKPLEYFRWTIESAFNDSQLIMSAFTAGRA
ncbi:class I SAM-dependent DNA methyltransferase [Sphingobium sp. B11D3A]|uniref:HsdM family class I SAM-dependent methyltransferase n=1 Tax=Sphingobium sp. B11D3A TaxID=2940574 RepID=UPI0022241613|nr:SAM-dependent methyltransferase [Sphingobium sp. B11D3A]MCW2393548.1 hypothetical protein [Sphingobium sp. B11D3A]